MTIVALDHVQIAAPEGREEQARAFYGELLVLAGVSTAPVRTIRRCP